MTLGRTKVSIEYPIEAPLGELVDALPFIERHRLTVCAHGRDEEELRRFSEACNRPVLRSETFERVEVRFASGGEVMVFRTLPVVWKADES